MLGPRSLLPALAAAIVAPGLLLAPVASHAQELPDHADQRAPRTTTQPTSRAGARVQEERDALAVTLDSLTPSVLGRQGPITITGTVTNTTDETWYAVNVWPHASWNSFSPHPMTTRQDVLDGLALPREAYRGDRFTDEANSSGRIGDLEAGETAAFTARITREQVARAREPGVYWVGVHAMGETATTVRDGYADGRASTLVPLVRGPHESVPVALALSLRQPVLHAPDGSLQSLRRWSTTLSPGGFIDASLRFGAAAPGPISWLVDPAVVGAVEQLAAGNPPRSLAATGPGPDQEPDGSPTSEQPSASASGEESSAGPGEGESDQTSMLTQQTARRATDALAAAGDAMAGDDLMLLPYGDVDAADAVARDERWLTEAIDRSGDRLPPWDLGGRPVVAPRDGLMEESTLAAIPPSAAVVVTDRALTSPGPAVVRAEDRDLVVADGALARTAGEAGHAQGPVEVRQQILAAAALSSLAEGAPLATVLPPDFQAPADDARAAEFFDGLDVPWLELTTVDRIQRERTPARATLRDGVRDPRLDAANFSAADRLVTEGRLLDEVLPRTDAVAGEVRDEAFARLSYPAGKRPNHHRTALDRSSAWIRGQLGKVSLRPTSVVLSSNTGSFNVTLVNGMDEPVEVQVRAESNAAVSIAPSKVVELQPGDRSTQLMEATSSKLGTHDVLLRLTTPDGTPIGPQEVVQVRANQVSKVIWVVIGVGLALLFGTIVRRLVRRVRAWRRTRGGGTG